MVGALFGLAGFVAAYLAPVRGMLGVAVAKAAHADGLLRQFEDSKYLVLMVDDLVLFLTPEEIERLAVDIHLMDLGNLPTSVLTPYAALSRPRFPTGHVNRQDAEGHDVRLSGMTLLQTLVAGKRREAGVLTEDQEWAEQQLLDWAEEEYNKFMLNVKLY